MVREPRPGAVLSRSQISPGQRGTEHTTAPRIWFSEGLALAVGEVGGLHQARSGRFKLAESRRDEEPSATECCTMQLMVQSSCAPYCALQGTAQPPRPVGGGPGHGMLNHALLRHAASASHSTCTNARTLSPLTAFDGVASETPPDLGSKGRRRQVASCPLAASSPVLARYRTELYGGQRSGVDHVTCFSARPPSPQTQPGREAAAGAAATTPAMAASNAQRSGQQPAAGSFSTGDRVPRL